MKSRVFTICTLVVALGFSMPGTAPAAGAEEIIVNGVRISKSRIDQRTRLLKLTDRKRRTQARDLARKELIDEVLFSEIIRHANVRVSQEDVERAYKSIAERVGLSSRDLSGALSLSGIRPETLKNRLRARIGMRRVKATLRKLEEAANERDIPAIIENFSTEPHTISNRAFHMDRSGAFHAACYDTECNSPAQIELPISEFPVPTELFRQRQALLKLTGGLTAAREATSRELSRGNMADTGPSALESARICRRSGHGICESG